MTFRNRIGYPNDTLDIIIRTDTMYFDVVLCSNEIWQTILRYINE